MSNHTEPSSAVRIPLNRAAMSCGFFPVPGPTSTSMSPLAE
jgi:hypothetical protein